MDKQKLYIETLGIVFLIINIGLIIVKELKLEVYMSFYAVGYLFITGFYAPKKRYFDVVGAGLLIIFCYNSLMLIINSMNI